MVNYCQTFFKKDLIIKNRSIEWPSFAQEVIDYKPTAVVVAGELETIEKSTELFHTPEFRVYGSNDIIGTSVSGAMKNVIAIAAGIVWTGTWRECKSCNTYKGAC